MYVEFIMNEQLLCINTIGCTPNCTGLYNFIGLYHCTGHYPSLFTPLPLYRPAPLYKPVPTVQSCTPPLPPPRQYRPVPLSRLVSLYPSLNMPVSLSRSIPLREQWYRPIPLPVPFHRIVMYSSCLYSKHGFITGPLL